MTTSTADDAASGVPDLRRVDQLVVAATLRRIHDTLASHALVVMVDVEPGARLDEQGLLDELAAVPPALGGQALWSLEVTRTHAGSGRHVADSRCEVRLDTVVPRAQAEAGLTVLASLTDRLRALASTTPGSLGRDDAIGGAREAVALVWEVDADRLRVSDEQHHPERGGWTIGLVDGGGGRFEVDLDASDGGPRTVRVRHRAPAEVADSIGESG